MTRYFAVALCTCSIFLSEASENFGAWMLVLRSTSNTGVSVTSLLESSSALNEDRDDMWSVDPDVPGVMKSGFINNMWNSVFKVRIEMYNKHAEVVMWMEFDGRHSSKTSWFVASNFLESSFIDNPGEEAAIFELTSEWGKLRCFYVANHHHGWCVGDMSWMRINDNAQEDVVCDYDRVPNYPRFYYSDTGKQKEPDECEPSADQSSSCDQRQVKMCKRSGRYLLSSPITKVTGDSPIACSTRCLSADSCKSYNYNREDKICELLQICANPYLHLSNEDGYNFWGRGNC